MAKLLLPLWVLPTPNLSLKPQFCVRCCSNSNNTNNRDEDNNNNKNKKLSKQSSWEAKDGDGKDYLYRLGKEADNMNIAVGQRAGIIDDVFVGNFLGKD
ncbi:ribulose bisphosphate carboxylase/oxygenase activase, partial [Trifolium pratense]